MYSTTLFMKYETRWCNVPYLSGRYSLLMGHLLKIRWGPVLYLFHNPSFLQEDIIC